MEIKECFHVLSKKAALAEKNMDLVSAFELWKQASLLCKNAENIDWYINRAMFCEAFLSRNPNRK
ncbi:ANR family transcriptional regulator [Escherichia coli]|nr:ANR family transcriptional regulator [Escherichia coli]